MNKWVKKSIDLADGHGYLDKLSAIYPVAVNISRKLGVAEQKKIKEVFSKKDAKLLIATLLNFARFPIDDPYIGFFRRDKSAIDRNPKTIKRIGAHLFKIGTDGIIAGIQRPKSSSRQFGQYFRNYIGRLGYPALNSNDFLKYKKTAFLNGGDAALKKFAKEHLGYRGSKGLDLVFRKADMFFIGEAKFISASGGTQDKSFRETMSFVKKGSVKAAHIAVIDGVVWATFAGVGGKNLYDGVKRLQEKKFVMSALLLKQFLKSKN